jgi:hypothetical protein
MALGLDLEQGQVAPLLLAEAMEEEVLVSQLRRGSRAPPAGPSVHSSGRQLRLQK